jgi:hypothetical protein
MADLSLATRPVIPYLQQWLSKHASSIKDFGAAVGLDPSLIVGGPLQEASTIITEQPRVIPDALPVDAPRPTERWVDRAIDYRLMPRFSSDRIAQDFDARKADIFAGKRATAGQKLFHPTGNDIGYGNVNLGTAIAYLKRYLDSPGDFLADPTQSATDPLHLRQYASDYAKFVADLTDPNSPATFAVAALIAKQGFKDFSQFYGSTFTDAPDDSQAALLAAFYKQGEPQFFTKRDFLTNGDTGLGAVGDLRLTLPDPRGGSGGPFVLDNFPIIKSIITGKHGLNSPSNDTAASKQDASLRNGEVTSQLPSIERASSLRGLLEQRGANLGIAYAPYMSTDALLAEIHAREGQATQPQDADTVADRIEREMDMIGAPFLTRPETADPPPLGLEPLTRASLDQRAARFGLRFGPAVPDYTVLAAVHTQEGDAAPPAAADALADRMEREIDQAVRGAGIAWTGGDEMDEGET